MSLDILAKEEEEKEYIDKFWDYTEKINNIISEEDEAKKDELKILYGIDPDETRGIL